MSATSPSTRLSPEPSRKDAPKLLITVALILAALAYINTASFNFAYDDQLQILRNDRVHSWEHAPRFFVEHVWSQLTPGGGGNYYRPVFELWLLANWSLFGTHPMGWHVTTLAVHLLAVWLAYLVLIKLTKDRLTAAIAALLFAVHPTHIESVAWISGVTDPLLAVFSLGSMLAYIRAGETGRGTWKAAAVGLFALALLEKEPAIVLPALLFGYDWLVERKRDGVGNLVRRLAPYAVTAALYLVARDAVLKGMLHEEPHTLRDVLLSLPELLWFYARHLLWPFNLSVFYEMNLVHSPGWQNFVLPLLALLAFSVAVWWLARRSGAAMLGAWWMALFLLPAIVGVSVFTAEDLVHDRYLYLPSLGLALVVACALRRLPWKGEMFGAPRAPVGIALALGAVMAASTALQNQYWANDLILFAHGREVAPKNARVIDLLAHELYKRHETEKALALYSEALQVNPRYWQTHFALGITLYELGDFRQAAQQLEEATTLAQDNPGQYLYLGLADLQLGRLREAESALRQSLAVNPRTAEANYALGIVLKQQGRIEEAKAAMRAEIALTQDRRAAEELHKLEH